MKFGVPYVRIKQDLVQLTRNTETSLSIEWRDTVSRLVLGKYGPRAIGEKTLFILEKEAMHFILKLLEERYGEHKIKHMWDSFKYIREQSFSLEDVITVYYYPLGEPKAYRGGAKRSLSRRKRKVRLVYTVTELLSRFNLKTDSLRKRLELERCNGSSIDRLVNIIYIYKILCTKLPHETSLKFSHLLVPTYYAYNELSLLSFKRLVKEWAAIQCLNNYSFPKLCRVAVYRTPPVVVEIYDICEAMEIIRDTEFLVTQLKETKTVTELHDNLAEYVRSEKERLDYHKNRTEIRYRNQYLTLDNVSDGDYSTKLPKTPQVIINWSKKLKNCAASYIDRTVAGDIALVGVFKKGVLYGLAEVRPSSGIRTENNGLSLVQFVLSCNRDPLQEDKDALNRIFLQSYLTLNPEKVTVQICRNNG